MTQGKHIPTECVICGAPATRVKEYDSWNGRHQGYRHVEVTCTLHESRLRGHAWTRLSDGVWLDKGPQILQCAFCDGAYGECGCDMEHIARNAIAWEASAIIRVLRPKKTTARRPLGELQSGYGSV